MDHVAQVVGADHLAVQGALVDREDQDLHPRAVDN